MSLRLRRPAIVLVALLSLQLVTIIGVLAAGTGVASAHAGVVATDPVDGSSVASAPARVTITFSESVTTNAGGLVVRDARGQRVDDGTSSTKGAVLSTGLRSGLGDGTYVATYRVLSVDGHPVSGSFLFGIGSGSVDRSIGRTTGDGTWNLIGDVSRIVLLVAALLAAGMAIFLSFMHDGGDDRLQLLPFVRIGSLVAFLAAVGLVMTQSAILTGRGAGASTDTSVLRTVLSGDLGLSVAMLVVGLVVVHLSTDVRNTTTAKTLALYGGLVVTVSFALWGHPTALSPSWLLMLADAIHATAAALWFGGLIGMAIVLRARHTGPVGSTALVLGRFSAMALWSVVALIVAGVALAVAGSDSSWHALVTTTWGRLVLLKMAVTAVVIAIATWNRRVLVPSIMGTSHTTADQVDRNRSLLLRVVRIEALVLVLVLAVTGVLTNLTPARTAVTTTATVTIVRPVETGSLTLTVRPAKVGSNTFVAVYTDATGQPANVGDTMTLEFSLPTEGVAPLVRSTGAASPGRFEYEGRELSIPGVWTVTLAVRTGVFSEQRTSFEIPVRP